MLFLIRHAQAGVSDHGDPNDVVRPLDAYGRDQANWIADRLADESISAFVSSPALRCVQTLRPAADRHHQEIVVDDSLAEGSSFAAAMTSLRSSGDHAAVCLHGDLLPEIVKSFSHSGMQLTSEPCFAKGVIWSVEFDEGGRPVRAGCELAPGDTTSQEASI